MAKTRGNQSPMNLHETAYETIVVERPEPRVARIVMNRPEARNAQNL